MDFLGMSSIKNFWSGSLLILRITDWFILGNLTNIHSKQVWLGPLKISSNKVIYSE